jgi:hypothetical protein
MDLGAQARHGKVRSAAVGLFPVSRFCAILVDPVDIVEKGAVFAGVGLDQVVFRPFFVHG